MIAIIRISGMVDVAKDVEETLNRLRLRRKYACVVVKEKPEILGVLKKVRNFIAYGKIDNKLLKEIIEKRGKPVKKDMKIDADKIVKEFIESKDGKKFSEFGIKNFFRLHPPRGGIKSKKHFPKGALGNHGDNIGKLIRRML